MSRGTQIRIDQAYHLLEAYYPEVKTLTPLTIPEMKPVIDELNIIATNDDAISQAERVIAILYQVGLSFDKIGVSAIKHIKELKQINQNLTDVVNTLNLSICTKLSQGQLSIIEREQLPRLMGALLEYTDNTSTACQPASFEGWMGGAIKAASKKIGFDVEEIKERTKKQHKSLFDAYAIYQQQAVATHEEPHKEPIDDQRSPEVTRQLTENAKLFARHYAILSAGSDTNCLIRLQQSFEQTFALQAIITYGSELRDDASHYDLLDSFTAHLYYFQLILACRLSNEVEKTVNFPATRDSSEVALSISYTRTLYHEALDATYRVYQTWQATQAQAQPTQQSSAIDSLITPIKS